MNLRLRRAKSKDTDIYRHDGQDRLLPKLSLAVYDHSRIAAIAWIVLAVFGILSYSVLLRREGFPSVNIPVTVISGAYLVNDATKVDSQVTKPISDIILKDDRVTSVQSQARGAFFTVIVQYEDGTDANRAASDLERALQQSADLPAQANYTFQSPQFGFTERGDDAVVTLHTTEPVGQEGQSDLSSLISQSEDLVAFIKQKNIEQVEDISVISPLSQGVNPATGLQTSRQSGFDRYAERTDGRTEFYRSVAIGIMQKPGTDVIAMDDQLRQAVDEYNGSQSSTGARAVVSAGFANDIKHQISELQRALLEGLIAVLIVGSILIAIRASIITVLSMLTVLAITVSVLFVVGYTLNTITLFSLILCLGLIVDDTIIMVEAIDAQRRRLKSARGIIRTATRKVSRAMVAATFTAALSFAPLIFVTGILGGFIRAIPVTVIISLLVSLLVALVFIPLFARYILLGKKQLGSGDAGEPAAKLESKIAGFIAKPMVWARGSTKRLVGVGSLAVLTGLLFIGAGALLARQVTFNIFPASKDTNGMAVELRMAPGTTIEAAEGTADRAGKIVADILGPNLEAASYYSVADERQATLTVMLTPYEDRDIRSPELVSQLNQAFDNFDGATVEVRQLDAGPPPSAFTVQVAAQDRAAATDAANDIAAYLRGVVLTRTSGEQARLRDVTVADPAVISRADGRPYVAVTGNFEGTDTSTLVTLAQNAIASEFNAGRLQQYGLPADAIDYDLGQEQSNQDSFRALALAFPILLLVIYLLLAVQFRSLLQPLLIFMAIPFSLFGIALGLYLSDNPLSFFAMLGFFALIGLSLKNTILLTDYANQLRREGVSVVDAAIGALHERFRPLLATSLTAVVSLIPLAITSPFWEGLAIVLIGGLLSSTLLVVTVFPYYYLGAEFIRIKVGGAVARRLRRRKAA